MLDSDSSEDEHQMDTDTVHGEKESDDTSSADDDVEGEGEEDQLMVYYACGRPSIKWYKRVFWRILDGVLTNGYILFKAVQHPYLRLWTHQMELAYKLTAPLIATRIGQGRSPSDRTLSRLKGKHFSYISQARKRCVVCDYKKRSRSTNKRRDTKTKTYCPKCNVHLCHGKCFERYHTSVRY